MKKSFALTSASVDPMKAIAVGSSVRNINTQLTKSLRAHAPFMALVFCYVAACIITSRLYDVADKISLSLYSQTFFLMTMCFFAVFFISHAIYVMLVTRPNSLTRYILNDLKTNYLTAERIMYALPILLLMPIFMSAFTSFKTMIPLANPYSWDPVFAEWDAALHGGVQPWELLQPILGHPLITSTINFFYNLWFFVMYAVLFWQAFNLSDIRQRMQFFLTFSASWVLMGTVVATLFSSVGPCYYGRVVGGANIFQPLTQYLWRANEAFPVWSLRIQEVLWEAYEVGGTGLGSGISAMPSMHVSVAFLFVVVGWQTSRALGIAFSIFALLIVIGSVHLGWHYAIDDYAAIAGTWLIWRSVGWLLNMIDFNK
jgi:hypothetical protein